MKSLRMAFRMTGLLASGAVLAGYGCSTKINQVTGPTGAGGATSSSAVVTAVTGTQSSSSSVVSTTATSTGMGGGPMFVDEGGPSCAKAFALKDTMFQDGTHGFVGTGAIDKAGKAEFFSFTAKKGDWFEISDFNPMGQHHLDSDMPSEFDDVCTVLSADGMTQLAEVDDAYPRLGGSGAQASADCDFEWRAPADGTYCLRMISFSDWCGPLGSGTDCDMGNPPMPKNPLGDSSWQYQYTVIPFDKMNLSAMSMGQLVFPDLNFDSDMNNTLANPQAPLKVNSDKMTKDIGGFILGTSESQMDKDVYKVSAPAGAAALSIGMAHPGTEGDGSTGNIGAINVWDGTGMTLLGQVDFGNANASYSGGGNYGFELIPIKPMSDYLIEVDHNAMSVGNDFYVFTFNTAAANEINPQEMNEMGNDLPMGAEAMTFQKNGMAQTAFIGGNIENASDVDFWKFTANGGQNISVFCASRRAGSGVQDFHLELYLDNFNMPKLNLAADPNPTKTDASKAMPAPNQFDTESATVDLAWDNTAGSTKPAVPVMNKSNAYLRISGSTAITNGATQYWYLCGVSTQ